MRTIRIAFGLVMAIVGASCLDAGLVGIGATTLFVGFLVALMSYLGNYGN